MDWAMDLQAYNYYISSFIIILSLPILLILLYIPAPFGRYHNWSWAASMTDIPGTVGWVLMESPNLWVPATTFMLFHCVQVENSANMILFSLYISHYIYRTLIFPFLQTLKPHILITVLAAFAFCLCNGFLQATSLLILYKYETNWLTTPSFICGVSLWTFGILTNIYSDYLLRTLRKPGETGYKIPRGFMFEYVSCANYFGEIVEWCGFALACWNLAALSFAMFTFCNLLPRALQHHKYYHEKFDNYPGSRKAVIPFIL